MIAPGTVILAIENSNPSSGHSPEDGPGVAIGRFEPAAGTSLLGTEPIRPAGRHDDDLMTAIDRLARRVGIAPPQIGRVAVSIGPGGYTALRIAIATTKMIAEATGAETIGIATAEVAARRVSAAARSGEFAIALASKAETAFVTVFGSDLRSIGTGAVLDASGLVAMAESRRALRTLIADEHIPDSFRRIARERGVALEPLRLSAAACVEASAQAMAIDPGALVPLYAREPEAVTIWRTRKS